MVQTATCSFASLYDDAIHVIISSCGYVTMHCFHYIDLIIYTNFIIINRKVIRIYKCVYIYIYIYCKVYFDNKSISHVNNANAILLSRFINIFCFYYTQLNPYTLPLYYTYMHALHSMYYVYIYIFHHYRF